MSSAAPVVLVVDDDAELRTLLVRALAGRAKAYEAADGQHALDLLRIMPRPDVILCDVMMPRLDGIAFAKRVKADPALRAIPIVFLTARDAPLHVMEGFNAGAASYLTKPFKVADVVARVFSLANARASRP
jgi:CheY-like chemotaxis protein